MKQLILKAISNRKRLNRLGKSCYTSTQFIRNLEYWISNGANIAEIVANHEPELRLLMTRNFIKQFEILKDEMK